jgi:hypothetical protein
LFSLTVWPRDGLTFRLRFCLGCGTRFKAWVNFNGSDLGIPLWLGLGLRFGCRVKLGVGFNVELKIMLGLCSGVWGVVKK